MDDLSLRVYLENGSDAMRGGWLELPVVPERLDAFMRGVVGVDDGGGYAVVDHEPGWFGDVLGSDLESFSVSSLNLAARCVAHARDLAVADSVDGDVFLDMLATAAESEDVRFPSGIAALAARAGDVAEFWTEYSLPDSWRAGNSSPDELYGAHVAYGLMGDDAYSSLSYCMDLERLGRDEASNAGVTPGASGFVSDHEPLAPSGPVPDGALDALEAFASGWRPPSAEYRYGSDPGQRVFEIMVCHFLFPSFSHGPDGQVPCVLRVLAAPPAAPRQSQAHEDHGDGRSGCQRDHARQRGAQQDGCRDEAAAGPARVSVVLEHPVLRLRLLRSGGICRRRAPFVGVSHRIVRIRNAVNGGFDYHVHIAGLPLVSKGRWSDVLADSPSSWFAPPCVPRVFRFPTGHRVFFFPFSVMECRTSESNRRTGSRLQREGSKEKGKIPSNRFRHCGRSAESAFSGAAKCSVFVTRRAGACP